MGVHRCIKIATQRKRTFLCARENELFDKYLSKVLYRNATNFYYARRNYIYAYYYPWEIIYILYVAIVVAAVNKFLYNLIVHILTLSEYNFNNVA